MNSIIDELLAESGEDNAEATITFTSDTTGRTFTAKRITKDTDWERIMRRAKHFENMTVKKTPASYHPYLPIAASTARGMAFMEATLLEPKLSIVEMLTLANKRGFYFMEISNTLQAMLMGAKFEEEEDLVDRLGEISDGTEEGSTSCASADPSGESTPIN